MSIESLLERIATSCERQERLIEQLLGNTEQQPLPMPVPAVPAPAAAPIPVPPPPAPAPVCPIHDATQLMAYCMEKYRTLGPVKGGMIQQVLTDLGCASMSAVKPEQYAEFYKRVEAIQ